MELTPILLALMVSGVPRIESGTSTYCSASSGLGSVTETFVALN